MNFQVSWTVEVAQATHDHVPLGSISAITSIFCLMEPAVLITFCKTTKKNIRKDQPWLSTLGFLQTEVIFLELGKKIHPKQGNNFDFQISDQQYGVAANKESIWGNMQKKQF